MRTSAEGRAAIVAREGRVLTAYKDSAGILTIGVGHTSAAGSPKVTKGMKITAAEADDILTRDLITFEAAVTNAVKVEINQNEFDALVSLAFNIGSEAFVKSTLLKKLNAGDRAGAADQFLVWNKATVNGKKVALKGLTTRRTAERKQFLTPVTEGTMKVLTAQQQILLDPAAGDLVSRYPAPPMGLSEFQKIVFAVQSRLTELKYPLGGLDGKEGTLTAEALRAAQADNGIPTTGRVDLATVQAILSWPERRLVPERENATLAKVEAIVPEAATVAKTRWWSKAGTWIGVGVPAVGGVGQIIEATGQAKTIMDTISAYLPSTSAIVVSLVFLAILVVVWRSSNKASAEMTDAVRTAARR